MFIPAVSNSLTRSALQIIDAHTVYEIANASKDFGDNGSLKFDPKRPYENIGLSREQLEKIALETGTSFAELNGETKGKTPDAQSD